LHFISIFYFILFYFILFYFILFYFILFYFIFGLREFLRAPATLDLMAGTSSGTSEASFPFLMQANFLEEFRRISSMISSLKESLPHLPTSSPSVIDPNSEAAEVSPRTSHISAVVF
jgi:hypothetical protein